MQKTFCDYCKNEIVVPPGDIDLAKEYGAKLIYINFDYASSIRNELENEMTFEFHPGCKKEVKKKFLELLKEGQK